MSALLHSPIMMMITCRAPHLLIPLLHLLPILAFLITPVRTDPFFCDSHLQADPLTSYSYTCDGIHQCVDKSDESGCLECPSGKVLFTGLGPHLSLYEAVFTLMDYKLRNKPVYKTADGSLQTLYITYLDTGVWAVSPDVTSREPMLVSSETLLEQPFITGITWSSSEGELMEGVTLECVPSDMRKCFGDLLVVSPDKVLKVKLSMDFTSDGRARYNNDQYVLRYVVRSADWDIPHWQVVNTWDSVEEIVFLNSGAFHPEFITTPGIYRSTEDGLPWKKSSNTYITCAVMTKSPAEHPLDCLFDRDTCDWSARGELTLTHGAADQMSRGFRAPPSAYLLAGTANPPGKVRIISPDFSADVDSCLLIKFASTVTSPNEDSPNVTVTLRDLYSDEVRFQQSECTNNNRQDCSTIDRYAVEMIPIDIISDASVTISFYLGNNQQPSGVISIVETALLPYTCDAVDVEWLDTCYDFDFPCNDNHCQTIGLRGYECQCSDPQTQSGPHCTSVLSVGCEDYTIPEGGAGNGTVTMVPGYYGDLALVECEDGFYSSGEVAKCKGDGTYTYSPECLRKECPTFTIPHSTATSGSTSTEIILTCDEGYLPATPQTLTCEKGEYPIPPRDCLLDCSYLEEESDGEALGAAGSEIVQLHVEKCAFTTNLTSFNFTDCVRNTEQIAVPGSVVIMADISANVSAAGEICARYAGGGVAGACSEVCSKTGVLRIIRSLSNGDRQSVQFETDFDYTRGKLINSASSTLVSVIVWIRLLGLLMCLAFS